jgi:hypothetical protein
VLTLDDFVMLGTTVPEPNLTDQRIFVCSAGFSPQLRSLLRLYPLAKYGAPPRWSVCTVKLERNPKDSRLESWKLFGDRSPENHMRINAASFQIGEALPKAARAELLARYAVESIEEANDRRLSLAIVHPDVIELEFEHNPGSPDSPQLALFDDGREEPKGARRFPYLPYLRFDDPGGNRRHHRLSLRDWGSYERMRKSNNLTLMTGAERVRHLSSALHLDPTCSLLVGNQNNRRTSWLVISVLRGLRGAPSLFDDVPQEAAA